MAARKKAQFLVSVTILWFAVGGLSGWMICQASADWFANVPLKDPAYELMRQIINSNLPFGISKDSYNGQTELTRVEFARDITLTVDFLKALVEQVRGRGGGLRGKPAETAFKALNIPPLSERQIEELSDALNVLAEKFENDIASLDQADPKQMLKVVESFREEMAAFVMTLDPLPVVAKGVSPLDKGAASSAWHDAVSPLSEGSGRSHQRKRIRGVSEQPHFLLNSVATSLKTPADTVVVLGAGGPSVYRRAGGGDRVVPISFLRTPLLATTTHFSSLLTGEEWEHLQVSLALPVSRKLSLTAHFNHSASNFLVRDGKVLERSAFGLAAQYQVRNWAKARVEYRLIGSQFRSLTGGGMEYWRPGGRVHGFRAGLDTILPRQLTAKLEMELYGSLTDRDQFYRRYMGELGYRLGGRTDLALELQRNVPLGNGDAITNAAALGMRYKMSPETEIRLLYQIIDYSPQDNPRGYRDSLLSSQLLLRF